MTDKRFSVIGRPLPKIDAWAKVTGETRYADDLVLPRMAHGKLLRSAHAHARIVSIDTSRAREVPGVYAVITGADLPRVKFGILPVSQDEEALCTEKVRMVGDAIAGVAAVDEETAERACRLIEVAYEPLPALMSIEESLAHPEVRIHEYGDGPNVHKNVSLKFGDLDAAWASADLVREEVFYIHRGRHPVLMWIKTGFTKAGDITGCHLKTWLDGGAYGSYGVASVFYTGVVNPVTYKMP